MAFIKYIINKLTGAGSKASAGKVPPMSIITIDGKTLGIDVSHHNGTLDWKKIRAAGVMFAFIKATEGITFKDKRFLENVKGAQAAGILVGAYHYFKPAFSGLAQADHFLSVTSAVKLDLPGVFDWEDKSNTPAAFQIAKAKDWLNVVELKTKKLPIIYTGPYFFRDIIGSPAFAKKYPLWIAHYGTTTPKIPAPWGNCLLHQYTETGKLTGVSGQFDLNVLNGDLTTLVGGKSMLMTEAGV